MVDIITAVNTAAFQAAAGIASAPLNSFMALLAMDALVAAIFAAMAVYFYLKKDKEVFSFVVAGLVTYVVVGAIKLLVREPRPCTLPSLSWINSVGCDAGTFSFPSEHAAMLTGLYSFTDKYRKMRMLYAVWLVLILFSRVYLGAHYLTDVIAGMVAGIVIVAVVRMYRKRIDDLLAGLAKRLVPQLFDISWT